MDELHGTEWVCSTGCRADDVNCAVVAGGARVRDNTHDIATNSLTVIEPIEGRRFQFFYTKGGTVSRIPEGFVFPKMTLATLLTSWFCGN